METASRRKLDSRRIVRIGNTKMQEIFLISEARAPSEIRLAGMREFVVRLNEPATRQPHKKIGNIFRVIINYIRIKSYHQICGNSIHNRIFAYQIVSK